MDRDVITLALANIDLPEEVNLETPEAIFRERLTDYIKHLLDFEFGKLLQLLYRIDVAEDKIKACLADSADTRTDAEKISWLIIDRLEQKINFRKQYASKNIP